MKKKKIFKKTKKKPQKISKTSTKSKSPKFIVIEGGEGSGKSSLLIALKETLGDSIFVTREPGGSPYAEAIRDATLKNPLAKNAPTETTLCLMFAARFDNTLNHIVPSLKKGIPVIADRFDASSYAYQIFAQSDGVLEKVFWNLRERLIVVPDLYIYVEVDPKEGLKRASSRNQSLLTEKKYDHFDDREIDFHKKVSKGYKEFFSKVPHVVVNANQSFEKVKKDFIKVVKRELGLK